LKEKPNYIWKIYLLYFSLLIFALSIIYKLVDIQIINASKWEKRTAELTTAWRNVEGNRGNIFSEDGDLLATSVPIYEVRMDMKVPSEDLFRNNFQALADSLSRLFNKRPASYYESRMKRGRSEGNRYLLIEKKVNYNQMIRIKTFPILKEGRYTGGIIFQRNMVRKKPFHMLASRTIGYLNEDLKVGLEAGFNEYLEGAHGKRLETRLAGGVWKPVDEAGEFDPEDGGDVITTIDINLQDVAEAALYNQMKEYHAHHGTVVVMEVKTGYIKAISNLTRLKSGEYSEQFNYAIGEATEPGSTFKLPVIMAALEDDVISIYDSVDTFDGKVKYYDQIMRDSKKGGYGKISVQRAFEVSSNVGVSQIITKAYGKDPQKLINRIKMMGTGTKLNIEIPGEAILRIKNVEDKDWSGVSLPWLSIGYEVLQTPLQTLTFYNAVANNGKMMKPQFVKEIRKNGKVTKTFNPIVLNESIASKSTIEEARFLLEGVVERKGTAQNLNNHELRIAGKTGTAQIAMGVGGYKKERKYLASFAGYFPAENPRYSCIVVIYAPSGGIYGNIVAGPIFREIADKIYGTDFELQGDKYPAQMAEFNVPISREGHWADAEKVFQFMDVPVAISNPEAVWISTTTTIDTVEIKELKIVENLVPNVKGMGAMDAVYLIESSGMSARIEGNGVVKQMSVQPGSPVAKGTTVVLTLGSV
jgi:cell division protein FtsI (penicillin-binding protein 3)